LQIVPQQGQHAIGEAACTVSVTPSVTLTCSMIRSERSGSMVIGCSEWMKKWCYWKFCFVLYLTTLPSSRMILLANLGGKEHTERKKSEKEEANGEG
jgi:hypothetical protein